MDWELVDKGIPPFVFSIYIPSQNHSSRRQHKSIIPAKVQVPPWLSPDYPQYKLEIGTPLGSLNGCSVLI